MNIKEKRDTKVRKYMVAKVRIARYAFLFAVLGLVLCFSACGGGDDVAIGVRQSIDSTSIVIGQQAHMTLEVTANSADKVTMPVFKTGQNVVDGVEIVSVDVDTVEVGSDKVKTVTTLTLTSFDEKKYTIPPYSVTINGKKHDGQQLGLEVFTVEVDTANVEKSFPAKDIQHLPFSWKEWNRVVWLSVLVIVLLVLGIYLYTRLKQNKPIVRTIRIVKHTPPHQKALEEIENIKASQLQQSEDQKEYYTKLTDVIRQYIKERFGFQAMEMTSTEIIARLNEADNGEMINELRQLFSTADLVKFAKYSTIENENDRNLLNAVTFIDKTKLEEQPTEERIESQLSEEDIRNNKDRNVIKATLALLAVTVLGILVYVGWYASTLIE